MTKTARPLPCIGCDREDCPGQENCDYISDKPVVDRNGRPVLLGISEIALEVGARRQTVAQWYRREQLPEPTQVLAAGPVWVREEIQDWITAKALLAKHDMATLANYMDDDLREQAHQELAPCAEERFLARYLQLHREQFAEEFTIN
jgi:predicted DNA-binding transcriptional regulator AlpA